MTLSNISTVCFAVNVVVDVNGKDVDLVKARILIIGRKKQIRK